MGLLDNFKIRGRFGVIAGGVCVMFCAAGFYAAGKVSSAASISAGYNVESAARHAMVSDVTDAFNGMKVAVAEMKVASDPDGFARRTEALASASAALTGKLSEYGRVFENNALGSEISKFSRTAGEFSRKANTELVEAVRANDREAVAAFETGAQAQFDATGKSFVADIRREAAGEDSAVIDKFKEASSVAWVYFWLALASFASWLLIYATAGGIASKIKDLSSICSRIAGGNLSMDMSKFASSDETGELAASLGSVVKRRRDMISEGLGLSESVSETSERTEAYSQSIADVANAAVSQSMAVAAASDELVSTTSEIAENCRAAASNSEGAKQATIDGMQAVKFTVTRIREQSTRNREDSAAVQSLGQQIQRIDTVVTTIQEIAEQTNLLALNAAIEAARAGEHGRGFAVVADEVRALAARTTQSTQEINEMVKDIHERAGHATKSMVDSVTSMDAVADEAQGLEATLNDILGKVDEVNVQISQIANASEQQSSTTANISNNMQHITESMQGIASQANAQNRLSKELGEMAEKLQAQNAYYHM